MFTVIEAKDHGFHQSLIDPFLQLITDNPDLSLSFHNDKNTTFIITKDNTKGICGGALLFKQRPPILYKKMGTQMNTFTSADGIVWTCIVCLYMEKEALAPDFEAFYKTFYRELYEKLVEFGTKEKINFLCMILEPGEYLCTEVMGMWPYVLEVRPHESLDGLFYGVLSLTNHQHIFHPISKEKMHFQGDKKLAA